MNTLVVGCALDPYYSTFLLTRQHLLDAKTHLTGGIAVGLFALAGLGRLAHRRLSADA